MFRQPRIGSSSTAFSEVSSEEEDESLKHANDLITKFDKVFPLYLTDSQGQLSAASWESGCVFYCVGGTLPTAGWT